MTLSFLETFKNGNATFFINKIWQGLTLPFLEMEYFMAHYKKFNVGWAEPGMYKEFAAKIHTIRADRANRWRVGKLIHFVIKNRTPYRFQFAPVMPVLGIQEIEIRWAGEHVYINIDSRPYCTNNAIPSSEEGYQDRLMILARNDGFDSVEDFLEYFKDGFSGKIIHWTDFTYLS